MTYNLDTEMSEKDEIIKAKAILQKENPFFSYIVSMMKFKEIPEGQFPKGTFAGVNSKGELIYEKGKLKQFSNNLIRTILAHEALHVALFHLNRRLTNHPMLWNIAVDIVVNNMLEKNGFSLLEGGICPQYDKVEIDGLVIKDISEKTAENVYAEIVRYCEDNELTNDNKGNENGDNEGNSEGNNDESGDESGDESEGKNTFEKYNGFDEHQMSNNVLDEEKEIKKWNQIIMDALTHSKMKGKAPKGMKRLIDSLTKPEISWNLLLQKYIRRQIPVDFTYSKPNKRSVSTGVYMPDNVRENIELVVTVDTSGSVSQKLLTRFLSEIVAIVKSNSNVKGTVLFGDCDCNEVIEIKNGNIQKLLSADFKGGGGTSHVPFYEWIQENKPLTKLVINLTDGYTEFPDDDFSKSLNSLWVIPKNDNTDIPFGTLIKVMED